MPSLTQHREYLRACREAEEKQNDQKEEQNQLYNEKTFYKAFVHDMLEAKKEIIIYCPFISKYRSEFFNRTMRMLMRRNIAVFIFTRSLEEQDYLVRAEIKCALKDYEELGACIIHLPGFIHAKVAIIDREILWEGSLNILSQRKSREMMRRTFDEKKAKEVMAYLGTNKKLAEGYKDKYERMYRNLVANQKEDRKIKLRLFFTGFVLPVLGWWLFLNIRVMIIALKAMRSFVNVIRIFI